MRNGKTMKRFAVYAVAVVLVVLIAGTAWAGLKRIGRCTAKGNYATCAAGGDVNRPRALFVKVDADPNQRVKVSWSTTCSKGTGAGSKSGHFAGITPIQQKIGHAYAHPDYCSLAASAQLAKKGSLLVVLKAKV